MGWRTNDFIRGYNRLLIHPAERTRLRRHKSLRPAYLVKQEFRIHHTRAAKTDFFAIRGMPCVRAQLLSIFGPAHRFVVAFPLRRFIITWAQASAHVQLYLGSIKIPYANDRNRGQPTHHTGLNKGCKLARGAVSEQKRRCRRSRHAEFGMAHHFIPVFAVHHMTVFITANTQTRRCGQALEL